MTGTDTATVTLSLSMPRALLERVDAKVEEVRRDHPYLNVSRSALVAHALGEWLELLDEPERVPTAAPRCRVRGPR
jgi:hypothetical protein